MRVMDLEIDRRWHVRALVAESGAEMRTGLRDLDYLPNGMGLLLPVGHGGGVVTMAGMVFPIDAVFLRGGDVLDVVELPVGAADVAIPPQADAVLELARGLCRRQGIRAGSSVTTS